VSQESTNRSFDDLARALAEGSISRRRALKLFAGTAIAALIPSRALAQQQKVIICHKPETPDEKTIEVSQSAVASHVRHGDRLGPCGTTTTTTTAAPTTTSTTSTTETPTTSTSTSTTSTSTTPMCIPLGSGPCTDESECCGLSVCEGGTCCASGNQVCNADSECCGDFTCQEGQCLPVCLPSGAICGSGGGPPPCCSGNCVNRECAACPAGTVELSNGTCATSCTGGIACGNAGCSGCMQGTSSGSAGYCYAGNAGSNAPCSTDDNCPPREFCSLGGRCTAACPG
jgi:hypothetical protein